jgi:hypothetical protein
VGLRGAGRELSSQNPQPFIDRFNNLAKLSPAELAALHDFEILKRGGFEPKPDCSR